MGAVTPHPSEKGLSRLLTEGLGLGVLLIGHDHRVLEWNGWLEQHSGIPRSDVLGHDVLELFPALARPPVLRSIQSCLTWRRPAVLSPLLHPELLPLRVAVGRTVKPMRQLVRVAPLDLPDETADGVALIIEDRTQAVERGLEIRRLTRLLLGLRRMNQVIATADEVAALLTAACSV